MKIEELNKMLKCEFLKINVLLNRPTVNHDNYCEYLWMTKLSKEEMETYVTALKENYLWEMYNGKRRNLYLIGWKKQFDLDIQKEYNDTMDSYKLFNKARYGK